MGIRHALTQRQYELIKQAAMDEYPSDPYIQFEAYLKDKFNGLYDIKGWGGVTFETEKEYNWFLLRWA